MQSNRHLLKCSKSYIRTFYNEKVRIGQQVCWLLGEESGIQSVNPNINQLTELIESNVAGSRMDGDRVVGKGDGSVDHPTHIYECTAFSTSGQGYTWET